MQRAAVSTRMTDETVTELFDRLSSGRADSAWSEFIARYSPLIMHVIRRHGLDGDSATECFIHVCAALSSNHFRRLRSFRPDGPASFKTWLMVVVTNLSVDWRRKELGRLRPLKSVSRLSGLEQQVYRCIYEHGMSCGQCLHVLLPRFPQLTSPQVSEINARLFAILTPQQRWQLSVRRRGLRTIEAGPGLEDDDPLSRVTDPAAGPDELTDEMQELQLLQDALARLPDEQRLLLRLRYEQDLTLAEVARLTRQPDPFRVNRQIHAALEALASLMGAHQSRPDRKSH